MSIVHERFTEYAGSEAVVEALARRWPQALLHAPVARPGVLPADLEPRVRSTRLSRLLRGSDYAHLLPVLPLAMRSLRLPEADVVVASHHAFATQVALKAAAPVVAYVHSPARWAWEASMRRGEGGGAGGGLGGAGLTAFSAAFKPFDVAAAQRVDTLVANSTCVAERIRRWWGREAQVVAPPVDTDFYRPDPSAAREEFFLLAGRMVPYKRPELAVEAAARAGVRLVVVGEGRSLRRTQAFAGPLTTFVGRVSDAQLRDLFRRCRALLMPGVEDFGIVPVEAKACGAPVIATGEGGALDTVVPGLSGEFVPVTPREREVEAWAEVLRAFAPSAFDADRVREHAETFSQDSFSTAMAGVVDRVAHGPTPPSQPAVPVVDLRDTATAPTARRPR